MCSQSVSVGVGVVMPEITIENIKNSNEMIMLYTGLPDFKTFQALFDTLMEMVLINCAQNLLVK